ncbi:MAG: site-2 protease family protein [Actinomycetota bacterium]
MVWSWKLGTFRGISVYVHATFLLLIGWILLAHLFRGAGIGLALGGVAFIVLLFGCVVLHEFGHALTAQRYGIQTRDITLYPIGGVARLERIPRNPRQELLIALAGPAVNVVIAAALFVILAVGRAFTGPEQVQVVGGSLLGKLMWVNVMLVLFNLLPAFPMDGGRVLRALLAERMDYGRATRLAATVGQGMAFLFGLLGLLFNPFLLFIAFFVYLGASQEAAVVQMELVFRGVPVRDAMVTRFRALAPTNTLAQASEQLLSGAQQEFPVMSDAGLVGLLTRRGLVEALSRGGPATSVAEAMEPMPPPASPNDCLETVFQQMHQVEGKTAPVVPVIEHGTLVGLITMENIGEFVMIQTALQDPPSGGQDTASNTHTPDQSEGWPEGRSRAAGGGRRAASG